MRAFKPVPGSTVSLAVTSSTGNVALTSPPGAANFQLRLYNAGTATVFVAAGGASVTAATTDMPIPAGAVEVLTFQGVTKVAAITSTGTATLYATIGEGV